MTNKVKILITGKDAPRKCEYCGKIDELRPYGKNRALICFECGMKSENIKETEKRFEAAFIEYPEEQEMQ